MHSEVKGHKEKCKQSENQSKLTFVVNSSEETAAGVVQPKKQEETIDTMILRQQQLKQKLFGLLKS